MDIPSTVLGISSGKYARLSSSSLGLGLTFIDAGAIIKNNFFSVTWPEEGVCEMYQAVNKEQLITALMSWVRRLEISSLISKTRTAYRRVPAWKMRQIYYRGLANRNGRYSDLRGLFDDGQAKAIGPVVPVGETKSAGWQATSFGLACSHCGNIERARPLPSHCPNCGEMMSC